MKNIYFNESNIIKQFSKGIESAIYEYKDEKYNEVLLKKFINFNEKLKIFLSSSKKHDFFDNSSAINNAKFDENFIKNKEKKIDIISSLDELKNEIEILDKVYDNNNNFIGYTMKKCPYKRMDSFDSRKDKIRELKLIKEKLEILNYKNIYVGDFNQKNFLVSDDKKDVKLCDLDNFKIGKYDFDIKSVETKVFNEKCNKKDYIDCFGFNIFTLSYLLNVHKPYLLYYLKEQKIPKFIKTSENIDIIDSMIHLDDTFEKKYIIDNIK